MAISGPWQPETHIKGQHTGQHYPHHPLRVQMNVVEGWLVTGGEQIDRGRKRAGAQLRLLPKNARKSPNDALGTLVKLVRCCNCKHISHFDIVRYLINFVRYQNKTFIIVQTL